METVLDEACAGCDSRTRGAVWCPLWEVFLCWQCKSNRTDRELSGTDG